MSIEMLRAFFGWGALLNLLFLTAVFCIFLFSRDIIYRIHSRWFPNVLHVSPQHSGAAIFLRQFASPITIILLLAAILSFCLGDKTDAVIIFIIVLVSSGLGYWQEKTAGNAVAQLLNLIRTRASAVRGGQRTEIPAEELVPGDVIRLSAGDVVPADCLLLEADGLFIDEAAFTGETFPVEKAVGVLPADTPLARVTNAPRMGYAFS